MLSLLDPASGPMTNHQISEPDAVYQDDSHAKPLSVFICRGGAQCRTGEDREGGRDLEPEGLPQRSGKLRPPARARSGGKPVSWTSYEKLRDVIERKMFT
jgi:hypothetical protein